jgi:hypothetical protein
MLSAIIEMVDFCEQRACIKFCFKLGKTATDYYERLKIAFGEQVMGCYETFQWFSQFKPGRTSIDDDECSGRSVSSSMPEMIESVHQNICEDHRHTIDEVTVIAGSTLHVLIKAIVVSQMMHTESWLSAH